MRQTNIELLRGLLMLFVVGVHVVNLGALFYASPLPCNSINFYWANIIDSFLMAGVDCFVLISGYFSINLNLKRLFKILFPCYFYAILIGGVSALFFGYDFLHINSFPILHKRYWFINSYFLLCLLSPVLNTIATKCNKKYFSIILSAGIVLFSIIPTFTGYDSTFNHGFGVINFCLVYLIGRYIKLYYEINRSPLAYLMLYLVFCLIIFVEIIIAANIFGYSKGYRSLFFWYNNFFVISSAVALFLMFYSIKVKQNEKFNKLATSFLSIYIIHSTTPISDYLARFVSSPFFLDSIFFPLFWLLTTIGVFLICLIFDHILNVLFLSVFQTTVEKWTLKVFHFLNYFIQKYKDFTEAIFNKLIKKYSKSKY